MAMTTPGSPWPHARRARLDNGLRVVVIPLPHLHTASFGLFLRVGSRYERLEMNGISHLLEHLLFRGCQRFPDVFSFNAAVERVCPGLGAATYRDFGAFDATCAPDRLSELLALVGAMLGAPLLADLELERRVILEEIADEVDERGRDVDVDNVAKRAMFGAQGLGLKIGGDAGVLQRLSEADCRSWFADHYGAANMVLAVAGPIAPDEVFAAARAALGALAPGAVCRPPAPNHREDLPALEYVADSGTQSALQLSWVVPPEHHPDWPAILMAQRLLDDGTCARLRRRIVDEAGLAYHVSADLETYEGTALLDVECSLRHANVIPAFDAIFEVLAELSGGPVGDEEWSRMRDRYEFELAASVDSAPAIASWYGLQHLMDPNEGQEPRDGLELRHARVMAVDREAVADVCRRHLDPRRVQVTVVGDLQPMARAGLRRRLHRLRGAPGQRLADASKPRL